MASMVFFDLERLTPAGWAPARRGDSEFSGVELSLVDLEHLPVLAVYRAEEPGVTFRAKPLYGQLAALDDALHEKRRAVYESSGSAGMARRWDPRLGLNAAEKKAHAAWLRAVAACNRIQRLRDAPPLPLP